MDMNNLINYLRGNENLYLYGAGRFSKEIIILCKKHKINIKGVIVTDVTCNPSEILGIEIFGLNDIIHMDLSKINLVVAITGNLLEIKNILARHAFNSVYFLPGGVYRIVQRSNAIDFYEEKSIQYCLEKMNSYIEPNDTIMCLKDSSRRLCRVEWVEVSKYAQFFIEECSLEELEKEYGKVYYIPHEPTVFNSIGQELQKELHMELYAVTSHLDNSVPENISKEGFIPIQVGAKLTKERKGCQTDEVGDNISERNRDYSECTALYWLWKNTSKQKYIGLNHYRRRLSLNDDSIKYIKENNVDIVVAIPHFSYEPLNKYFQRFITDFDWNLMKKYAMEYEEKYKECIDIYEKSHFFFPCNIALFKREIFDSYCEFAFYVTDKIYSYYKEKNWVRNDRYMGYIFENLESLFIMRHKDIFRIGYSDVIWIVK